MTERGVLWRAAEADVEAAGCNESAEAYLQRVKKSAREFLRHNELHGREAVVVRVHLLVYVCFMPETLHSCVCV